ncbi:hypothetical protein HanXRQr2_Chr04g0142771 [Helianthus annuus]|uniref:Uncharacterized protein n=1 Tax=Helianthus annuus TaxID=4232 RepID=A0A9K3NQI3_HELAN|nr:hypothetical protein HanXRQr2_Chr04g0142771 [Helianthus annuus]KAJ0579485.1 hypothetical protein HanHA300_Chr04g0118461 [Helianthus annuus]KAJ0595384.1 hypothetical protein HanHA89_Chr04g0130791 [Helianthus annuus]KAJ0756055.1 hypothetical protein HanLR1_Chr04g0122741 [Helianthus annuus]KAJ0929535.1 hypothetical protein HanPSC8_Chr04g0138751 [Helianthus annuus]
MFALAIQAHSKSRTTWSTKVISANLMVLVAGCTSLTSRGPYDTATDYEPQSSRDDMDNRVMIDKMILLHAWCSLSDGLTRQRERCVSEVQEENDKEFSVKELYESNNIQEIISRLQIDKTTIDQLELLKNLKGWTVKKYKRTETNGRYRVDKTFRHPKSKKWLRSLFKVREFILDSSHIGKASDNGEGGSQIEKVNLVIKELVEENDEEEEKLNRIIAGPSA